MNNVLWRRLAGAAKQASLAVAVAVYTFALPSTSGAQDGKPASPPEKKAQADAVKSSPAAITQYRRAVMLQNRSLFKLAAEQWEKFLAGFGDDPLAPQAQHYAGVCYFQIEDGMPKAEAAFGKVAKNYPGFEMLSESLYYQGLAQYNQGQAGAEEKYRAALATFGKLLEDFGQSQHAPSALYYQAETHYNLGDREQAVAAYDALLTRFPQHELRPLALYGKGVALEELQQYAEAAKVYDSFLADFPEHEYAREVGMRRGEAYLAEGDYEQAVARFRAAADAEGFAFADYALSRCGECLFLQGKYQEAADAYVELTRRFPKSPRLGAATLAAGKCFYLLDKGDACRQWLAAAARFGGETKLEAAHWLAKYLLSADKPQEALAAAAEVIDTAGESPWGPHLKLGRADALYELPERRKEAIQQYASLAQNAAEHEVAPQAVYMAGFGSLKTNAYADALEHVKTFRARYPENALRADVEYVAAEAHLLQGDHAEAAELYKKLASDYPQRPERPQWIVRQALCRHLEKEHQAVLDILAPVVDMLSGEVLAEAQFLIGSSHLGLGDAKAAVAALTAAKQASGTWRQADETLLLLAQARRKAGDVTAGLAAIDELIERFPESEVLDEAHYRRGELLAAGGNRTAAQEAFSLVVSKWPDSALVPHALFGLATLHLEANQFEAAGGQLDKLLEQYPDHALSRAALYARALAQQQAGHYQEALANVQKYLATEPSGDDLYNALLVRGQSEAGLQQYDKAIETLASILADAPQFAAADSVLYELGWAHQAAGNLDQAAERFSQLVEQHPESDLVADALFRIGEAHYDAERYGKAARVYYDAYMKAGKSTLGEEAAHKLAWSYFQQEDFDKAQGAFKFQLDAFPEGKRVADAQTMLGECYFKQGKFEEALAIFQQAASNEPSSQDFQVLTLLHAGQSAGKLKKWEQSLSLLNRCLKQFPDSSYASETAYEKARALQALDRTDEARELFQTVAEKDPGLPGAKAKFMWGELQFAAGEHSDAVGSFFDVAYGYGYPKSPEAYHGVQADALYEAARCLEVLKKPKQAKMLYQELVENYPQSDKVTAAKSKLADLSG